MDDIIMACGDYAILRRPDGLMVKSMLDQTILCCAKLGTHGHVEWRRFHRIPPSVEECVMQELLRSTR